MRWPARLRQDGVEASFAMTGLPDQPAVSGRCARLGDAPMCEVTPARALRWVETRSKLRREARALRLHHRFYYLAPEGPNGRPDREARTTGARGSSGRSKLNSTSPVPTQSAARRRHRRDHAWTARQARMASLDRFAAELGAEHLHGVPFSTLTG